MKSTLLFLLLCLLACTAAAQKKLSPQGSVRAGLLEGEDGSATAVELTAGLRRNTWSAAVGAGLDYYLQRSVPLFLRVQKNLSRGSRSLFLYAAGGHNLPWLKPEEKTWSLESRGGLYFDGGLGVNLPVMKANALQFSLGWSHKQQRQTINTMPFLSVWPPPPNAHETLHYRYSRLALKIGLAF